MSRLLVACAGFRDPVYQHDGEVRSSSSQPSHEIYRQWLKETIDSTNCGIEAVQKIATYGPLATALFSMARLNWRVDRLLMVYNPEPNLNVRVEAAKKLLVPFLGNHGAIEAISLPPDTDVADYEMAYAGINATLPPRLVGVEGAEIRIVLGPGTPQLNLALALLPLTLPHTLDVSVWQVKHPRQKGTGVRSLESVPQTFVRQVRFGSGQLPALNLQGRFSPDEARSRQEIDELRLEVSRLRAANQAVKADGEDEDLDLKRAIDQAERRAITHAIATERGRASEQRKAPTKTGVARMLGISRQDLDKRLDRLGIAW